MLKIQEIDFQNVQKTFFSGPLFMTPLFGKKGKKVVSANLDSFQHMQQVLLVQEDWC